MNVRDVRDVPSLIKAIEDGAAPEYVHFWGHRPPKHGGVSVSCFSQWYASPFSIRGARYATAEHYMMAEKARVFGDYEAERQVLATTDPAMAKRIGRSVRGFEDHLWKRERFGVAVRGNEAKFSQNAALGTFLRSTVDRVLVEASPVDAIWGIGLGAHDPRAYDPKAWQGENLLGFVLMEVRALVSAG